MKNLGKRRCIWLSFLLFTHRTSQLPPVIEDELLLWFSSLHNLFAFSSVTIPVQVSLLLLLKGQTKREKKLKELFIILSLLHSLLLDVWVNDSLLSLLTTQPMKKAEVWDTWNYTCSQGLDINISQQGPSCWILGSPQFQKPLAECRWDLNHMLLLTNCLGDFLFKSCYKWIFKCLQRFGKNCSHIKFATSYIVK